MKSLIILLAAALVIATAFAQQATQPSDPQPAPADAAAASLTPEEIRAIDEIAQAELKSWRAPGMVLAVVRADRVILRTAYGLANVETGEPMAPDMMVSVASISKPVTAATALVLAAEGKLDLEAPVRTYLPWLPERLGAVTMTQLLSHTAGLGDSRPPVSPDVITGAVAPIGKAMTDEVVLAPAGTLWAYTNQGYTLAGCVIEAAGGAPFAKVVGKVLFQPLGMTRSTFEPRVAMTYRHAQGHETFAEKPTVLRPFGSWPPHTPAGELITTVDDLTRLARALLADGMLDGRRALPSGILARMAIPRGKGIASFGSVTGPGPCGYGLGLVLRQHRELQIVGHLGLYDGFGAWFCLVPERGLAAIAVANARHSAPQRTTQAAIETAAGLEPTWTEPSSAPLPAAAVTAALGMYTDSKRTIEIALSDGRPCLRAGDAVYPIVVRSDGVWEVPGYLRFLPIPAVPIELLDTGTGMPPRYLRLGWWLYRRLDPDVAGTR